MGIRSDICHSHSIACRLVTEPSRISFAPSTPRIYESCTLLEPEGEEGTLTFVSRPNDAYQRLFLATLSSCSIPDLQVLVKLAPCSYSRDVHKHMADTGLAPNCMAVQRWKVYQLPMSWNTLTRPFGKHYTIFPNPKRNSISLRLINCEGLFRRSFQRSMKRNMFTAIFEATS